MAARLRPIGNGALEIKILGALEAADPLMILEALHRQLSEHGRARVLFDIVDALSPPPGELWYRVAAEVDTLAEIDRVAVVGDAPWLESVGGAAQRPGEAVVKQFDQGSTEEALEWLAAESPEGDRAESPSATPVDGFATGLPAPPEIEHHPFELRDDAADAGADDELQHEIREAPPGSRADESRRGPDEGGSSTC
jgi:hypothetical protein